MFQEVSDKTLRRLIEREISRAQLQGMNTTPMLDELVEEQGRRAERAEAVRERTEASGVFRLPVAV